ncbi:MAG: aldo/keto reductase [Pseudomonadota bacterium]
MSLGADSASLPLRPLGRTGLRVSPLGLGTVAFGRQTDLKYPREIDRPSDAAVDALLARARALGINLLDTATAYGDSQERLGQRLRKPLGNATSPAEPWVVVTKLGERYTPEQGSRFDFSVRALAIDLERSQEALGRQQLDVVLLHSDGRDETALMAGQGFAWLKRERDAGRIRAVGASLKSQAGLDAARRAGADVVMMTLNPQEPALGPAIGEAAGAGIGVLIKKPFSSGRGHLADLAWGVQQPGVDALCVGTLDPEHLEANARCVGAALSPR